MKLNQEELIIGAIVGLSFAVKVGWWAILLAVLTSPLWAMGGAEKSSKLFRRLGVPLACSGLVAIIYHNWVPLISLPLASLVLHMGYGIPSTQPVDEGSWLGRLCFKWANKNEKLAELYCRTIIYTLLTLAFIPCFIVN